MKKLLTLAILLVTIGLLTASPSLILNSKKSPSHPMTAQIESINNSNSDGVSRIALTLFSQPSTSSRIDSATLLNRDLRLRASDIDGVDFQHYFQWEDDGKIFIELDFPRQKSFGKGARIILHTVHGDYLVPIKK